MFGVLADLFGSKLSMCLLFPFICLRSCMLYCYMSHSVRGFSHSASTAYQFTGKWPLIQSRRPLDIISQDFCQNFVYTEVVSVKKAFLCSTQTDRSQFEVSECLLYFAEKSNIFVWTFVVVISIT